MALLRAVVVKVKGNPGVEGRVPRESSVAEPAFVLPGAGCYGHMNHGPATEIFRVRFGYRGGGSARVGAGVLSKRAVLPGQAVKRLGAGLRLESLEQQPGKGEACSGSDSAHRRGRRAVPPPGDRDGAESHQEKTWRVRS